MGSLPEDCASLQHGTQKCRYWSERHQPGLQGKYKSCNYEPQPEYHLRIELGDRIAQFIMTRYETLELLEVIEVDATQRGSGGFGSNGK